MSVDERDAVEERLLDELRGLGPRSVGAKIGRLGALVAFRGEVDDVPSHVHRIAERYDLTVLLRETSDYGRGRETYVEVVDDDRLEEVLEHTDDVEVLEADDGERCSLCGAAFDERLPPEPEFARVSESGVGKCFAEDGVFVHDETDAAPLRDPDAETESFSVTVTPE